MKYNFEKYIIFCQEAFLNILKFVLDKKKLYFFSHYFNPQAFIGNDKDFSGVAVPSTI